MSDFLSIMGDLTNYVQNERTSSYNEGVDMILGNVREWMHLEGIKPKGEHLPDLLNEIAAHIRGERTTPGKPT